MQVKLKVLGGSHSGREIPVTVKQFLIGRADECQLRPKSESVSRRHCAIVIKEGRALVQDLNSRNGTFVNGKQLPPDKAKVLKAGDVLRVGKIEVEVLIEVGLGGAKQPEVKSVEDAAARVAAAGKDESRFEELDITTWLAEADQIDRKKKLGEPETRQLRLDETVQANIEPSSESGELSSTDSKAEEREKGQRPKKEAPGKLPKHLKQNNMSTDSREAAGDALKRFFSGR